jgi:hypothetical protein
VRSGTLAACVGAAVGGLLALGTALAASCMSGGPGAAAPSTFAWLAVRNEGMGPVRVYDGNGAIVGTIDVGGARRCLRFQAGSAEVRFHLVAGLDGDDAWTQPVSVEPGQVWRIEVGPGHARLRYDALSLVPDRPGSCG